jgi:hypothetical protein
MTTVAALIMSAGLGGLFMALWILANFAVALGVVGFLTALIGFITWLDNPPNY